MVVLRHLNCGVIVPPAVPGARAACHCLLLQEEDRCVLIDTGIGLMDCLHPRERLGKALIEGAGFQLEKDDTAIRHLQYSGVEASAVTDIVLTHADPDHTGGLADFPHAAVHLAAEELANVESRNPRYVLTHFAHKPQMVVQSAGEAEVDWFGIRARLLPLPLSVQVVLVPLPGHTRGHCGVAVEDAPGHWVLHAGDAYYLRAELDPATPREHPIFELVKQRADDDAARVKSLGEIGRVLREHGERVSCFGYHDFSEFPREEKAAVKTAG
ncbi:MAG: MBL fold metallo-hydrolase [Phycisphaerae bacterium]